MFSCFLLILPFFLPMIYRYVRGRLDEQREDRWTEAHILLAQRTAPKTKACPLCAETIKSEAVVCHHCGRDVPGTPTHAHEVVERPDPMYSQTQRTALGERYRAREVERRLEVPLRCDEQRG